MSAGELVLFAMMTERLLWPINRLGTTLDDAVADIEAWVKDPDAELPRCTG